MDGLLALRSVLVADEPLRALVPDYDRPGVASPVSRIFEAPAPEKTPLPFIMLQIVSSNDRNVPAPGERRFVWQRVEATILAANSRERRQIKRALRRAAADHVDVEVEGLSGVTIHTDSAGPDFYDEDYAGWRGSQDFMVKYNEER